MSDLPVLDPIGFFFIIYSPPALLRRGHERAVWWSTSAHQGETRSASKNYLIANDLCKEILTGQVKISQVMFLCWEEQRPICYWRIWGVMNAVLKLHFFNYKGCVTFDCRLIASMNWQFYCFCPWKNHYDFTKCMCT